MYCIIICSDLLTNNLQQYDEDGTRMIGTSFFTRSVINSRKFKNTGNLYGVVDILDASRDTSAKPPVSIM